MRQSISSARIKWSTADETVRGGFVSTFRTVIEIANKTDYTLTLNPEMSQGIDASDWPSTIAPNTTVSPFSQGWNVQIKFVACYEVEGVPVGLDFYADAVEVFDCKVEGTSSSVFAGSSAANDGAMSASFVVSGQP
jgi:hypothetical protein